MAKKGGFGVNNYLQRTRKKLGRHKKRMNQDEKRAYKKNRGQGRCQTSYNILYRENERKRNNNKIE